MLLVPIVFLVLFIGFAFRFMWLSAILGLDIHTLMWVLLAVDCLVGFFHYGMLLKSSCVKTTLLQDVVSFCIQIAITVVGVVFFLPYAHSIDTTLYYATGVVVVLHILSMFYTICFIREGLHSLHVLRKSAR